MSLPTEFDGIPHKSRNKRIDALYNLIVEQMQAQTTALQTNVGTRKSIADWYAQNSIAKIHGLVAGQLKAVRANVEAAIPPAIDETAALDPVRVQFSDIPYMDYLNHRMLLRPNLGFLSRLSGAEAEEQDDFIITLQEDGEKMLDKAQNKVEKSAAALKKEQDAAWNGFCALYAFYEKAAQETRARNLQGLLDSIAIAKKTGISSADIANLLKLPVDSHDSVLAAFSGFALSDYQDLRGTAQIMQALDDPAEAVGLLHAFAATVPSLKKKQLLLDYAQDFSGVFITGPHNAINSAIIMGPTLGDAALDYYIPGGDSGVNGWAVEPRAAGDAETLLRHLKSRPEFIELDAKEALNSAHVVRAAYVPDSGTLQWQTAAGNEDLVEWKTQLPQDAAMELLADLSALPGFMLLPDASVMDTRKALAVTYDETREILTWQVAGGANGMTAFEIETEPKVAALILAAFATRADMVPMGDDGFVSTTALYSIEYDDLHDVLKYAFVGGDSGFQTHNVAADAVTGGAMLKGLQKTGLYHRTGNTLFPLQNIEQALFVERQQETIYHLRTGHNEVMSWTQMADAESYAEAQAALVKRPGFAAVNTQATVNLAFINHANTVKYSSRDTHILASLRGLGNKDKNALSLQMQEGDGKTVADILGAHDEFIAVWPDYFFRKDAIVAVDHDGDYPVFTLTGGSNGTYKVPVTSRAGFNLAQLPDNFYKLNDDSKAINMAQIISAEHDPVKGSLHFFTPGGPDGAAETVFVVTKDEAKGFFKALHSFGQRVQLSQRHGLDAAQIDKMVAKLSRRVDKITAPAEKQIAANADDYAAWIVFSRKTFANDIDAALLMQPKTAVKDAFDDIPMPNGNGPLFGPAPETEAVPEEKPASTPRPYSDDLYKLTEMLDHHDSTRTMESRRNQYLDDMAPVETHAFPNLDLGRNVIFKGKAAKNDNSPQAQSKLSRAFGDTSARLASPPPPATPDAQTSRARSIAHKRFNGHG